MAQRDKVSQLPDDIRRWLDQALAEGNFSDYEQLAAELKDRGYDISRSSVHRYGQRLERRLSAIKASTEAARAIAEAAPDDADHRSAAVISLVQSEMFELLLAFEESADLDPASRVVMLSKAARGIADLARASLGQKRHEEQLRQRERERAAALAEKSLVGQGMSRESVDAIKREILGIA